MQNIMSTTVEPTNQPITYTAKLMLQQKNRHLAHTNSLLQKQVETGTAALQVANSQLKKEVLERTESEKKFQEHIKFSRILTDISTQFINLSIDETDEEIATALEKIAKITQFDRSYIYLFEENGRSIKNTHAWCGSNSKNTLDDFQTLPSSLLQNWMPQLMQQNSIRIQHIKNDPEKGSSEEKLLTLQNVQSALIIPLVFGKETIGYLGLDAHRATLPWQDENIDLLKVVGDIFVSAIMRKKTENNLAKERLCAQQIMATMGQGLMIIDVEGVLDYVNTAFATMLGCQPEALIGNTLLDITHTEDRTKHIQAHMALLQGESFSFETQLIKIDGSSVYALVSSVPHYNYQDTNTIIGSITTITDLTDRRRAEAKTEANAAEIKEIYEAAVQLFEPTNVQPLANRIVSIVIERLGFDDCSVLLLQNAIEFNADGLHKPSEKTSNSLTWVAQYEESNSNNKRTILLNANSLIATAVRQGEVLYAPDVFQDPRYQPDNTWTQSKLVIPLQTDSHIIGAIVLQSRFKNGFDKRSRRIITRFSKHASLALAKENKTNICSREISDINVKLAQALRTKDQFLANMSHELRTPLSAILGVAEILKEELDGPITENQVASLHIIEENGRHILQLINDITNMFQRE